MTDELNETNMTNEPNTSENNEVINKKKPVFVPFEAKTANNKFKVDCWNIEKNGDLTPRDVNKKSKRFVWFTCDVCLHDFQRTIYNICHNNKWCPYCFENMVCDNDDCDICYNNSFASLGE